jgi:hypothetical protein
MIFGVMESAAEFLFWGAILAVSSVVGAKVTIIE